MARTLRRWRRRRAGWAPRSAASSRSSSTRPTSTPARRVRSRCGCARRTRSISTAGTRTAPSGTTGSSGRRRRAPRSRGCCTPSRTSSPSRPPLARASAGSSAHSTSTARPRIVISEYEFPTVGQIAHAQELRGAEVVHVRPEADGSIPPERFAEASTSGPRSSAARRSPTAPATGTTSPRSPGSRTTRARSASPTLPGGRRDRLRRARARRRLRHRRDGQVPARLGRARLPLRSPRAARRAVPTQTGWFADEDIFRMDISDYSPAPTRAASTRARRPSEHLRGLAGMSIIEEAGARRSRRTSPALVARLIDGLDELGAVVVTPRDPARRARSSACARPMPRRSSPRSRTSGSSARRATRTSGSLSTFTTSTRTSTPYSTRCAGTASCLRSYFRGWPSSYERT